MQKAPTCKMGTGNLKIKHNTVDMHLFFLPDGFPMRKIQKVYGTGHEPSYMENTPFLFYNFVFGLRWKHQTKMYMVEISYR